jgi:aspartyl-tRNA(Asn)/glutamyl-tRNA(Gln) amidotransferase subunit C
MRPTIEEAQVLHVARLARLELSADEVAVFAGQLGRILAYVQQLEQLDTAQVEPLAHPLSTTDAMRADRPRPGLSADEALANAPQRHGEFFRVPAVLEGSGGA